MRRKMKEGEEWKRGGKVHVVGEQSEMKCSYENIGSPSRPGWTKQDND